MAVRRAVVATWWLLEPASGSVSPKAIFLDPSAIPGSHSRFIASDPWWARMLAADRRRDHPDQHGHPVGRQLFDDDDGFGHAAPAAAILLGQVHAEQTRRTEVLPQLFDALAVAAPLQEVLPARSARRSPRRSRELPCALGIFDQS